MIDNSSTSSTHLLILFLTYVSLNSWLPMTAPMCLRFCGSHVAHSHPAAGNIAQSEFRTCYDDITDFPSLFTAHTIFYLARILFTNRLSPGSLVFQFFLMAVWSYSVLYQFFCSFNRFSHYLWFLLLSVMFDEWYAPHLPNFPHMALVDPRNWFSDTFPRVPSAGFEPQTFGLRVWCSNH